MSFVVSHEDIFVLYIFKYQQLFKKIKQVLVIAISIYYNCTANKSQEAMLPNVSCWDQTSNYFHMFLA